MRHQLPQSRVLIAQLLGFLRLAHIHPAVLRLPGVDRVFRDAHFPCHIFLPCAPTPAASAPRSSALPCACSSTYLFPFLSTLSTKSYSISFGFRGSGHPEPVAWCSTTNFTRAWEPTLSWNQLHSEFPWRPGPEWRSWWRGGGHEGTCHQLAIKTWWFKAFSDARCSGKDK